MDIRIIFLIVFITGIYAQTTPAARVKIDKCAKVKCKEGQFCDEGKCKCFSRCPEEWNNAPRQLCIDGKTYRHECDFKRNLCYCTNNDAKCGGTEFGGHKASSKSVVQYFAPCVDFAKMCDWNSEGKTFHERLGRWFQQIYSQKWSVPSGRSEDESLLRPLNSKARQSIMKLFNKETKSTYGVHGGYLSFWFCEMDRDNSGSLDKQELGRLSQLLNPSTPCLNAFLAKCGSGSISNSAWHTCFKVHSSEKMACSSFN